MERHFPAFVTLHKHGDLEGAAAFAAWRQTETIVTRSREDILARIQVALASRAAEELFLDVSLSGVTGDLASATQLAASYVGMYGMDGTFTSVLAFAGTPFEKAVSVPKSAERIEAVLQSQFKAVKRLFQEHSEALMAVAESLIERDELVADEIKQLIDEADARRVNKIVNSQFEELLGTGNGNGHSNGTNGNGYALIGGHNNDSNGSGNGNLIEAPKTDSTTLPSADSERGNIPGMQTRLDDDGLLFYLEG